MSGRVKKPTAPKKKANGYKMPAPIANGEIIHDTILKKKWRIGPSIGVGGFGEIYSACDHEASPNKKGSNYPFVIKIEPHENGPLFVEKHFYIRNANKDDIAKYMRSKKLSTFGMPTYFGNGSHDYKGEKYRYLVLERYGKDLWTQFLECSRTFPVPTVFQIGLQMLEVLEYIHSKGYVHADIKGANILLGLRKGTEQQVYLVDFGLATRVTDKEFKPDPKCAHNGTIEYTSRDAHLGVATMRGDLEILAYNMLQWIVGALPWETCLTNPRVVQDAKEAFMKNVRSELQKRGSVPDALIKFFEYINTMKPKDNPDYIKCRQLFESYLKTVGKTRNSKLDFTPDKKGKTTKSAETNDSAGVTEKAAKKRSQKENGDTPKKVVKKGRAAKIEPKDSEEEVDGNDNVQTEENKSTEKSSKMKSPKKTGKSTKKVANRGRAARIALDYNEGDENCERETENDSVKDEKNKSTEKVSKRPCKEIGVAAKKLVKNGRAANIVVKDSDEDTDNNDDEERNSTAKSSTTKSPKENGNATNKLAKKSRAAKILVKDSDEEAENCENETPNSSIASKAKVIRKKKTAKRKSTEPTVLANIKRTKFAPKATPPVKKNHANIATQTSGHKSRRSPRQVSFDSPICEIIGEKKPSKISKESEANSSGDIFDDTFVIEEKKVKSKKMLISDEEITVKRVLKKKVTTIKPKGKSWRDAKTIVNGASPPKS